MNVRIFSVRAMECMYTQTRPRFILSSERVCKVYFKEGLLAGCLTSQQHVCVSQGLISSENCRCCHTETEAENQIYHLTQSQCSDTGTTSRSPDPITPGAWQGTHWSANFEVTGMTRPGKIPTEEAGIELGSAALEADALTTRPPKLRDLWSDPNNVIYGVTQTK